MVSILLPLPLSPRLVTYPSEAQFISYEEVILFVSALVQAWQHEHQPNRSLPPLLFPRCRTEFSSGEIIKLEWKEGSLLGGKGGFGAGLRASGKNKSKSQQPQSFALCRNLQGNRLGELNTVELLKQSGESPVVSEQWVLDRPNWADPVHKTTTRNHPTSNLSSSSSKLPVELTKPPSAAVLFERGMQKQLDRTDESIDQAVLEGKARQEELSRKRSKIVEEENALPASIQLVSGQASVKEVGLNVFHLVGQSEFSTVAFQHTRLSVFKVHLLSSGLIQVGFMDVSKQEESTLEPSLNGVGDVMHSVGIDCARLLLLTNGSTTSLSNCHHRGTLLCVDGQTVSWGGEDVLLPLCPEDASWRFCVSLEEGESVEVNVVPPPPPSVSATSVPASTPPPQDPASLTTNSLNYSSCESLESAGAERLKAELQSLGLKFGGTTRQRAMRLLEAYRINHPW